MLGGYALSEGGGGRREVETGTFFVAADGEDHQLRGGNFSRGPRLELHPLPGSILLALRAVEEPHCTLWNISNNDMITVEYNTSRPCGECWPNRRQSI